MRYAFRDTDTATERLKILNDVFAESSGQFLRESVTFRPNLALDLGCGPGYTTHLLAELLNCERVVGLDTSERFIHLAQEGASDRVSFYMHDVTCVPFPVGPADLIYCRYLVTHLRDPQAAVETWATQLCTGGLLLIEENEWIRTGHEVFERYIGIVEAMLAGQSNDLYAGRELDRLKDTNSLKQRSSEVRRLRVPYQRAAAMFYLNIQTWKANSFIQNNYPRDEIEQLQQDLKSLSGQSSDAGYSEWGIRQLAFERM
jgi:trans-aconitate 2-methyltransferase